jgi:hypothetical protein
MGFPDADVAVVGAGEDEAGVGGEDGRCDSVGEGRRLVRCCVGTVYADQILAMRTVACVLCGILQAVVQFPLSIFELFCPSHHSRILSL